MFPQDSIFTTKVLLFIEESLFSHSVINAIFLLEFILYQLADFVFWPSDNFLPGLCFPFICEPGLLSFRNVETLRKMQPVRDSNTENHKFGSAQTKNRNQDKNSS